MTGAILFSGPSLRLGDLPKDPRLDLRGPVQRGDVYQAAQARPRIIGIIDGSFDGVAAVGHKEILWALSQGITVFGASSMGALRAAELHVFGMEGIGAIFAGFRDGTFEDDDEVALVHGPRETGYLGLSEPMVNIRATLAAAAAEGVIAPTLAESLTAKAKALFYQDRDWRAILDGIADAPEGAGFRDWLVRGKRDQKRADAQALLARVMAELDRGAAPARGPANFHFEATEAWNAAPWRRAAPAALSPDDLALLDQLRLEGPRYRDLRREALLREVLAGRIIPNVEALSAYGAQGSSDLRLSLGLWRQAELANWEAANGLEPGGCARLSAEAIPAEALARDQDSALGRPILDLLRAKGEYGGMIAALRVRSAADLTKAPDIPAPLLLAWYFEKHLHQAIPADLAAYLQGQGFRDEAHFLTALQAAFLTAQSSDHILDR